MQNVSDDIYASYFLEPHEAEQIAPDWPSCTGRTYASRPSGLECHCFLAGCIHWGKRIQIEDCQQCEVRDGKT